eukprot:3472407-Pleurochrysis_carterae.AAC.2
MLSGQPYVVGTGCRYAASQVDTDPCLWFHAGLGVSRAWLHCKSATTEWQDTHNSWLVACEQFVGRCRRVGQSGCA